MATHHLTYLTMGHRTGHAVTSDHGPFRVYGIRLAECAQDDESALPAFSTFRAARRAVLTDVDGATDVEIVICDRNGVVLWRNGPDPI